MTSRRFCNVLFRVGSLSDEKRRPAIKHGVSHEMARNPNQLSSHCRRGEARTEQLSFEIRGKYIVPVRPRTRVTLTSLTGALELSILSD